nr:RagB/SusD family nutrient uptake outer membrane protein [uncultured Chitinophaga sp.]
MFFKNILVQNHCNKYANTVWIIRASIFIMLFYCSCNKFVDVGTPGTKITSQELFKDDASATSAVLGIYSQLSTYGINILSGGSTLCGGLAADEITCTSPTSDYAEYQNNAVSTLNFTNQYNLWSVSYKLIYQSNACIEGLANSNSLTPAVKKQLLGEVKTIRSLTYFYLIQLFGAVPLITQSDYKIAAAKGRTATNEIYDLIISDLIEAENLMKEAYPSEGRLRPNSYTASALLARVYLYTGNWLLAEKESDKIIRSQKYALQDNLNQVFLAGSNEAIWQVQSTTAGANTSEGSAFVNPNDGVIPGYLVSDQLMTSFEAGDPRRTAWIGNKKVENQIYHFPYKYKVPSSPTTTITENYVMFRLAEQYLIRAESAIRRGKTTEGIADLNIIRKRARGNDDTILPDIRSNLTTTEALTAVLHERRTELMTEWGHRWQDLKRFKLTDAVLKPIKPDWQDYDTLFPIPDQEIQLNKSLTQNSGYN